MKRLQFDFRPRARRSGLLTREVAGELLIYDLKQHKAFCLNETAAAIWKSCNGKRSVTDLAAQLVRKTPPTNNEEIVWLALRNLDKYDLLQLATEKHREIISRRSLVRTGLATAIALPLITVITAPIAVQAATAITAAVCATRRANDLPGQRGCLGTPCVAPGGTICRRVGSAGAPCGCA